MQNICYTDRQTDRQGARCALHFGGQFGIYRQAINVLFVFVGNARWPVRTGKTYLLLYNYTIIIIIIIVRENS